jgi:hypothetical protein
MSKQKLKPMPSQLRRELNSPAFISGLKWIIDFMHKEKREAGFGVDYVPEIGTFVYPDTIDTGDETSIPYFQRREAMQPYYAELFSQLEVKDLAEVHSRSMQDEEFHRRYIRTMVELEGMRSSVEAEFHQAYPETEDQISKRQAYFDLLEEKDVEHGGEEPDRIGDMIFVHTHPPRKGAGCYHTPSPGDLSCLQSSTSQASYYGAGKDIMNPVSVITAVRPTTSYFSDTDLFFFQQKKSGLPEDSDFKRYARGFRNIYDTRTHNLFFPARQKEESEEAHEVRKHYNFSKGHFDALRGRRKTQVSTNDRRWRRFAEVHDMSGVS